MFARHVTVMLAAAAVAFSSISARAAEDAAHALAEKFAAGAPVKEAPKIENAVKAEAKQREAAEKAREAKRKAAEAKSKADAARREADQLKSDEADMLAQARADAEERRRAQLAAQAELERAERERAAAEAQANMAAAETARKAAEDRSIEAREKAREAEERKNMAERTAREAEQRRLAEEQKTEEARVAAEAARRAADERQASADQKVRDAEQRAAEAERAARDAEERRVVEERRAEDAIANARQAVESLQSEEASRRLEIDRELEGRRLAGKLRIVEEERAAAHHRAQPPEQPLVPQQPIMALGAKPTEVEPRPQSKIRHADRNPVTRVTVLLSMKPGLRSRGYKTADPMLCLRDRCYISTGSDTPAKSLQRWQAFGPGVALMTRAGACRGSPTCVFRDVDLGGTTASLQPIDLRILRHDRRETSAISADMSCAVAGGRLDCADTVEAASYTAWIVPESVAAEAGGDELRAVLKSGLSSSETASADRHADD